MVKAPEKQRSLAMEGLPRRPGRGLGAAQGVMLPDHKKTRDPPGITRMIAKYLIIRLKHRYMCFAPLVH